MTAYNERIKNLISSLQRHERISKAEELGLATWHEAMESTWKEIEVAFEELRKAAGK